MDDGGRTLKNEVADTEQQLSEQGIAAISGGTAERNVASPTAPKTEAQQEEARLLRRLQMMMNMVTGVIAQDATLTYDDAATMVADARTAALAMFPGKEVAYDLIWKPRFQRLIRERFRLV